MYTILLAAVTANGFIARSTDELANWTSKEDKKLFVEETKKAGVMIMGRTTFATIGKPLPGRLILVLTKDPASVEMIPGSVEPMSGTPAEVLKALEVRGFTSAVIAGGASIYSQFLNAGLVDELVLTVEGKLFTSGVPLAGQLTQELDLNLLSAEKIGEKSAVLRYRIHMSTEAR